MTDTSKQDDEKIIEEKDREISALREQLGQYQGQNQLLEQQLLGANMAELRGRRLADTGLELLIQTASQNAAKLAEIQRAAEEAQSSEG